MTKHLSLPTFNFRQPVFVVATEFQLRQDQILF